MAIMIPPNHDSESADKIAQRLCSLHKVAKKKARPDQGDFKIITCGIQKGPGATVSTVDHIDLLD